MLGIRVVGFSAFALSLLTTASLLWSQPGSQAGPSFGISVSGMRTRGSFNNSEFSIIDVPAVQKELSLTDEQKAKVKELCTAFQQASVPAFPSGRPVPGSEEMRKALTEAGAKAETFTKEKMPELLEVLTAEQKTRLSEIMIQVKGFASFLQPEVQEKLDLTAEQKEKLTTIEKEYSTKLNALRMPGRTREGGATREASEKIQSDRAALIRDRADAAKKLLTEKQRQRFEELRGKEFDQSSLVTTGSPPTRGQPNEN